ncbi:MAG: ankyrin repeat domain-containing protein [archaeon]|nr:ankyrin repeat domain-containing protein [archaeon]
MSHHSDRHHRHHPLEKASTSSTLLDVDPFALQKRSHSGLMAAIDANDLSGVRALVKKGAKVNELSLVPPFYESLLHATLPLHFACFLHHRDIVEFLLKHHAEPHLRDLNRRSAVDCFRLYAFHDTPSDILSLLSKDTSPRSPAESLSARQPSSLSSHSAPSASPLFDS